MSELAEPRARPRTVADSAVRRALRFLLQPPALGLLLALLAAGLLGSWFYRQATEDLATRRQDRIAIQEAVALAQLVSAQIAAAPDDDAALQASVQSWVDRSKGDVRVVRLGGARLLASTFPADGHAT